MKEETEKLRAMLFAHKAFLCALMASHPDKGRLASSVNEVLDQMQGLLLGSNLDDAVIAAFDEEVQSVIDKTGLKLEGYQSRR